MTILFLDQFTDPGGAQRCLIDLLPAVRARGWNAHVAAPGNGALVGACEAAGVGFSTIRLGPFHMGGKSLQDLARFALQAPALRREIARLADASGAALIYVNGPRLLPAVPAVRPVVFHCHVPLRKRYVVHLSAAALKRTGATVIGCCRYVLDNLRPHISPDRMHVVYNGVPAPNAAPRKRMAGAPWRIGLIGRVAPEKGQAEFLEAARHLIGCEFIICGAPLFGDVRAREYGDRLRRLAAGLPVTFLGWREDIGGVLASLDLLALPSDDAEATSRVALEAAATCVPVVAFRSGGIPEVIKDGYTGFLTERRTSESLAARIREAIAAGPERLAEIGRNARAAWSERFTLECYQHGILSIVGRALGSETEPDPAAAASAVRIRRLQGDHQG